MKSKPQNKLL